MFCRVGTMPSTAVMCCCSRVSGIGVGAAAGVDGPASAFVGDGADWDDVDWGEGCWYVCWGAEYELESGDGPGSVGRWR